MSDSLFALTNANVGGPAGPILRDLTLTVPRNAITAILGPPATGKSVLLATLTGTPPPPPLTYTGTWTRNGAPLFGGATHERGYYLPQRPSEPTLDLAAAHQGDTLLLDEPERSLTASALATLITLARQRTHTTLIVTHNVRLASDLADYVLLLVDGRLESAAHRDTFFDAPPTPLTARFLRDGNCWPPTPNLPSHFRWILPGQLAGLGRPGLLRDALDDLRAIAGAGVTYLVTLTEEPPPAALCRKVGIETRHLPIPDMGIPSLGGAMATCRAIEHVIARGDAAAFHCHAGLGRTGTMLAAYLIWTGTTDEDAIARVRDANTKFIQSRSQLSFLRDLHYAAPTRPSA